MRWLLFLAKVTAIFNVLFIFCLIIRYSHIQLSQALSGFVLITGWFLSVVFNVMVHSIFLVNRAMHKPNQVPRGIFIFNLFVFIFQIFYFLIIQA